MNNSIKPFHQQIAKNNQFYLQKIQSSLGNQNITQTQSALIINPVQLTFNFQIAQGYYDKNSKIQFQLQVNNPSGSSPNYYGNYMYIRDEFVPFIQQCTVQLDNDIIAKYACLSQDQLSHYQTNKQSTQKINDLPVGEAYIDVKKWRQVGKVPDQNFSNDLRFAFPFKKFFPHILKNQKYFHVKQQCLISFTFQGAPEYMFGLQKPSPQNVVLTQPVIDPLKYTVIEQSTNQSLDIVSYAAAPTLNIQKMNVVLLMKKYLQMPNDYMQIQRQPYYNSFFQTLENNQGTIQLQCNKMSDYHYFSLMDYSPQQAGLTCFNQSQYDSQTQQIQILRNNQLLINADVCESSQDLLQQIDALCNRKENNNIAIFTDKNNYEGELSFNITAQGFIYFGIRFYKQ